MCVTSDKGTVHIFRLGNDQPAEASEHEEDSTAVVKGILPKYFSSEWSFAQFKATEARSQAIFLGLCGRHWGGSAGVISMHSIRLKEVSALDRASIASSSLAT